MLVSIMSSRLLGCISSARCHCRLSIVTFNSAGYRLDYFVEKLVIVEIKAVEKTLPIHTAQLLAYLKMTNCRVGPLINFNVVHLRSGIRRVVNG
jgi:GxxExxY protein